MVKQGWQRSRRATAEDLARTIEEFLDGTGRPWDWDDFTQGGSFEDDRLERIRLRCAGLSEEFPTNEKGHYCSDEGLRVLRSMVTDLRQMR